MVINKKIKAVIIDDEQNNVDNLRFLLMKHCENVQVVAAANNAESGEQIIREHNPDVVFLDIQMPEKSGFDLLSTFINPSFEIIFVTAYDKYGIQAIKFSAIDYLLKPIDIDELKTAVNKVFQKKNNVQSGQIENLLSIIKHQQQKEDHRIALTSAGEINFVKTSEIIRCESSNNYTTFFFIDGKKQVVSRPISEFEEMLLPYDFVRCHQSHLISKKFIKRLVKKDGGYFVMDDNVNIPISKQRKEMLKTFLEW